MRCLNISGDKVKLEFQTLSRVPAGLSHYGITKNETQTESIDWPPTFDKSQKILKGVDMQKAFTEFAELNLETTNDGYDAKLNLTASDKQRLIQFASKNLYNRALLAIAMGVLRSEGGAQCWFKTNGATGVVDHGNYIIVTKNLSLAPEHGIKANGYLIIPVGTAWGGVTGRNCLKSFPLLAKYGLTVHNTPKWSMFDEQFKNFSFEHEFSLYHPIDSELSYSEFNDKVGQKVIVDSKGFIRLNYDLFKQQGVDLIYSSSVNDWKDRFVNTYKELIQDLEAAQAIMFANIYWQNGKKGLAFKADLPNSSNCFEKYMATPDRVNGIKFGLDLLAGKIPLQEVFNYGS